jgi:hypoxanthine-guanine phosphoribosyltransferase
MQKLIFSYFQETINDIFHNGEDLSFVHSALLLEQGAEIAFVTVLSNDIAMRSLSDDIEALQDVGMFEFGQGLDFAI